MVRTPETVRVFNDFDGMIRYYQNLQDFNNIDLIAFSGEIDQNSIIFINPSFTLGVWITPCKFTIGEIGFHLIPEQVFNLEDVKSISYNADYFEIFFKDKSPIKFIKIDFTDITKSEIS